MRQLIAIVGLAWPLLATAQTESRAPIPAPPSLLRGSAIGFTVDRYVPGAAKLSEGLTAVSLHVTSLEPHAIGLDAAIGMWPQGLGLGLLLMGIDIGGAYNVSTRGATLLLKAGPSALLAAGGGGGAAAVGGHLGAGAIVRLADGIGIRSDVVEHYYYGAGGGGRAMSVSLGITSLKTTR